MISPLSPPSFFLCPRIVIVVISHPLPFSPPEDVKEVFIVFFVFVCLFVCLFVFILFIFIFTVGSIFHPVFGLFARRLSVLLRDVGGHHTRRKKNFYQHFSQIFGEGRVAHTQYIWESGKPFQFQQVTYRW